MVEVTVVAIVDVDFNAVEVVVVANEGLPTGGVEVVVMATWVLITVVSVVDAANMPSMSSVAPPSLSNFLIAIRMQQYPCITIQGDTIVAILASSNFIWPFA
uniref:Uncharacterized protein n=1 Tax=Triticum urartu TaxID=4572 RepID=A0A8R7RAR0_TRIUA